MKISIITSTFNSENTIRDCLESLHSQSYPNYEHIVIDGNSSDNTLSIIKKYKRNIVKIISEPDTGIYNALNKGIKASSGDIIGFLHSDDYFANNYVLEKIAKTFIFDESISVIYGDLDYVNKRNANKIIRKWRSKPFHKNLLKYGWMPPHPTIYTKRELLFKIGGFDESFKISGDYMQILEIFSKDNLKFKYIPEVFLKMRVGGASNKSIKNIILKIIEDSKAMRKNDFGYLEIFRSLIVKNLSKVIQFF